MKVWWYGCTKKTSLNANKKLYSCVGWSYIKEQTLFNFRHDYIWPNRWFLPFITSWWQKMSASKTNLYLDIDRSIAHLHQYLLINRFAPRCWVQLHQQLLWMQLNINIYYTYNKDFMNTLQDIMGYFFKQDKWE